MIPRAIKHMTHLNTSTVVAENGFEQQCAIALTVVNSLLGVCRCLAMIIIVALQHNGASKVACAVA